MLDDRTVKAINSPKRDRQIDTVIVNMERWRWLPRQLGAASLGNAYVILNIPDFTLKVMQNGAQVWTTRVVTGKPGKHATPLLTETMKFITVNPTWNVPPSIIYNEYLPALQQDPTVLQRMGLSSSATATARIHISQPPGEANALGRIRFNFPNKFLVYQHDTPGQASVRQGRARLQPWLHAGAESGSIRLDPAQHHDAERALHAGENPQHVRPQRDRPEIPDADPGQHHLPDRVRGRCRQAADPQGHLWPRRRRCWRCCKNSRNKDLENMVAHAQPNYTRPSGSSLPAGVNFASDNTLLFRTLVLRAAVRRPVA